MRIMNYLDDLNYSSPPSPKLGLISIPVHSTPLYLVIQVTDLYTHREFTFFFFFLSICIGIFFINLAIDGKLNCQRNE